MTESEACTILNMIPRMGPVLFRRLCEKFGEPSEVLALDVKDLLSVEGVGNETARSIASWKSSIPWETEMAELQTMGVRVLTQNSPEYPALLKEIHDPPIALYCLGKLLPRDRHAMGVVGTRKPSHYAAECAKKLSYQMAYSGLTVTSGLARGVDTYAHHGAIAAKGRTVAVIGSGLKNIYPPENRELVDKIVESGGAVLSEFSLSTKADRQTFPMRNRIISGMSIGILVVEAGARSGALITANQAGEQGRSVYAIPGRIDFPGAMGSNRLIQQGAKLVLSVDDLLEDFQLLFPERQELAPPPVPEGLGEVERQIYTVMGGEEETVDTLVAKSGLPSHLVSSSLLGLEMRKLVKSLPGSRFLKLL